jgi:hypothetical protein
MVINAWDRMDRNLFISTAFTTAAAVVTIILERSARGTQLN